MFYLLILDLKGFLCLIYHLQHIGMSQNSKKSLHEENTLEPLLLSGEETEIGLRNSSIEEEAELTAEPTQEEFDTSLAIPASIQDALIHRKNWSPGSQDSSSPPESSEETCQGGKEPFTFFCSKRNRRGRNTVIVLYFQNTLFCLTFVIFLFLS